MDASLRQWYDRQTDNLPSEEDLIRHLTDHADALAKRLTQMAKSLGRDNPTAPLSWHIASAKLAAVNLRNLAILVERTISQVEEMAKHV
jgi:hypothetical protein